MGRREGKCSWERFLESQNATFDHNDTISRLPESVLNHVVSFLPSLEKDQVRFLSRKWRRIAAQSQKKLSLTRRRLDEQELSRILVDDFHSVDFLCLRSCSGMKTLKLVNFNLKTVKLNYCGSLKSLELDTPHLENFEFIGRRLRPCRIEFAGICKNLKMMHLSGVSINNMMFMDCNKTFPFLIVLLLSCDMMGCINISSNSLCELYLTKFNKSTEITVTAPNLKHLTYNGSEMCSFSNTNVGRLVTAEIILYPRQHQQRNDTWFHNLNEMLRCLKPETVLIVTNSEKNIIIPKQLRQNLMPPLDENEFVQVKITSGTRDTIDLVDLAHSVLWMSPRLEYLSILLNSSFIETLRLVHGPYSRKQEDSCSFCNSHPIRCWRHSVTQFYVIGDNENLLKCDLEENLQKVDRVAIYEPIHEEVNEEW